MNCKIPRRLLLESFEPRRMFYAYSEWAPKIAPGASPAEHAAHFVQYNTRYDAAPDQPIESYSSRPAVDAKLAELVSSYWEGLLGEPVADVQAVGSWERYLQSGYGDSTSLARFNASTDKQFESNRLAKTEDGYLYVPSNAAVTIVNAQDPNNLSSTSFTAVSDSSDSILWVDGNRLIRVSKPHETYPNQLYGVTASVHRPQTRVEIFDISNRSHPALTGSLLLEGDHVASDVRNGRLTLVQFSDFNLVLPQPGTVARPDGTLVFESTADYLSKNRDAIYAAVVPNYQRTADAPAQAASDEIGDWQDLNVALDSVQHRTSVVTIDIAGQPKVVDSEIILGLVEPRVYVGADNVYLINNTSTAADIYRVTIDTNGNVDAKGFVRLVNAYVRPEFLNEYDGVLRVLAGPRLLSGSGEILDHSSFLLTIGDAGGQWRVQGQVKVANSLLPTGIYFDGPQAIAMTGDNYFEGQLATNYIVSLDLSDPSAPRKLNSFQVPGFSTYLKQIDSHHWIGLRNGGPGVRGSVSQDRMVTLYSYSPDTGLQPLDNWTESSTLFNANIDYPDMEIQYEPQSGLVMIDGGASRVTPMQASYNPILLRAKLGDSDPLQPVTIPALPDMAKRTFVHDGHLVVVTDSSVVTYDATDLSRRSDIVYLPGSYPTQLGGKGHRLVAGQTQTIPVLGGYGSDYFTVKSVEVYSWLEASKKSKVTILDNGMLQVQAADVSLSASELLTIRVQYFDGQEGTLTQSLFITGPKYREPVEDGNVGYESVSYLETNTPVKIWSRLQNEVGQPVNSLRAGEEAWVIVGAEDLSELRLGVHGGYFQVDITSGNAQVVGEPEFFGNFKLGKIADATEHGFSTLGATSLRLNPNGSALADIVRFKIRASNDAPVNISVAPTIAPDNDLLHRNILVYMGANIQISGNADVAVLSTDPIYNSVKTSDGNSVGDVNGDGSVTALDVLQIINYINTNANNGGEASVSASAVDELVGSMDVSGDGAVTALDALLVINTLNVSPGTGASGEGEPTAATQLSTMVWSFDQLMRRSRR